MRSLARRLAAALLVALAGLGAAPARSMTLPTGFHDETVFEGLEEPTALRFAPDGRVFVAEKSGEVVVYDSLEDPTPTVFANLRTQVYDLGDRGILGLALDPDFAANHYVYVLYTYDHLLGEEAPAPKWGNVDVPGDPCEKPPGTGVDDCPVSGRLVRLTAEGDHAVEEDGAPAEDVLVEDWCAQYFSHSIGDLEFGPEGALYASGGEGGDANSADYGQAGWPQKNQCGDPPGAIGEELTPPTAEGGSLRAQNTENLDGSVIRVDPATGQGVPGNPMFASSNANRRRIVAYGFRNPFRFALDPATSEVYVGNVGWNRYEEIDRFAPTATPAFNSGWPCYEGPGPNAVFKSLELNVCEALYHAPGSTAAPFFYYNHSEGVTPEDSCDRSFGSAIAGLDFYEGEAFPPAYKGALFFSDPVRGCLYAMFRGGGGRPDPATTVPFLTDGGLYPGVDIQEGPEGDLYYAALFGAGYGAGSIHRVSYLAGNEPPVAHLAVDHEWSAGSLTAEFDATGSSDGDGEALEYEWDPEGDGSYEAATDEGTKTETFADSENHTVAVRVRDGKGATSVDRVTVYPHDTPPEPEILEPESSLEWHVDQAIHFAGAAEDGEDGPLPPTSLGWSSRLYHCPSSCHAHPLQAFPAVASGTLIAPDHEAPSRIELSLTATDSRGLAVTRTLDLYPHEVELTIDSDPRGLSLSAGDVTKVTPFVLPAIEGSRLTVAAPHVAEAEGTSYTWSSWSDGGARVHAIVAAASGSLTASYTAPPAFAPDLFPPAVGSGSGPSSNPSQPPSTLLRRHPHRRTRGRTARFAFSANADAVGFRCKLDAAPFRPCRSPRVYRHLSPGGHVLRIVAVGPGGADPTPVTFRWTVLRPR